ncbi:Protein-glutamate O-methyltransferase [Chionoecetes opilio]|uniref:Sugar phosphate phosphatase n=1 Tax=Chionoecetes opilio TaxID=41210 RepID=A0A8J4XQD8_CHIOP|nr:Protein-glutamate O-methyltransferase [Chionoecetes opilio]
MDLPLPPPLSGNNVGSFAYLTVKDRLPVILTRVIDYLHRERTSLGSRYGMAAQEGCKEVVGRLSQMKNEMQTNKDLQLLQAQPTNPHDDSELWNHQFESYVSEHEVTPKWFTASWLYVECHMYARIHEALFLCNALREFDPFEEQKQKSLEDSLPAIEALIEKVSTTCTTLSSQTQDQLKQHVLTFFEVSLWGNRCDLSLSGGDERFQEGDVLLSLEKLRNKIIVNDSNMLWQFLTSLPEDQRDIVLVVDNAGFELVSDLCLLTVLMEAGLTTSLTIHTKTRPWFVSDTMETDLRWTVDKLRSHPGHVGQVAAKWSSYLSDGRWKICNNKFWTTGHDFSEMSKFGGDLYSQLSKASLIIFKGDLNYRKLTGDLEWPTDTKFEDALQGFRPAPLLAVRTAKGGPVVGLLPDQGKDIYSVDKDWNTTGDYGMIQLCTFS